MRPREFLRALDQLEHSISPSDPRSELVLTLVAHMLHADRGLTQDELELVAPLASGVPDKRAYFNELSKRPLDLERLAATFPDPADRKDLLQLAEHCLWCDGIEDE